MRGRRWPFRGGDGAGAVNSCPSPARLFLCTLAAGPRAAAACSSLERSLAPCLYQKNPGAALELATGKRKVSAHPGRELPGSARTAGPPT